MVDRVGVVGVFDVVPGVYCRILLGLLSHGPTAIPILAQAQAPIPMIGDYHPTNQNAVFGREAKVVGMMGKKKTLTTSNSTPSFIEVKIFVTIDL